jgi:DNA-binding NarL/FixJ family response regulator
MTYRIVVADDHWMVRKGIRQTIEEHENDLEVLGEAGDGLKLLDQLKSHDVDLVLLDISMPKLSGIKATHKIKSSYPKVKILMLTVHKEPEYLFHALAAGADGYILKEDTASQLLFAIDTIRQDGVYISPLLKSEVNRIENPDF